ncbi:hypothetical protein [Actinoplanes sp. URMC 104]
MDRVVSDIGLSRVPMMLSGVHSPEPDAPPTAAGPPMASENPAGRDRGQ